MNVHPPGLIAIATLRLPHRVGSVVLLVLSLALGWGAGCGGGDDEEFKPLQIEQAHGPFEFCESASGTNLTNATWLAFFAGNEYAHFYYLGPAAAEHGFGDPSGWDQISEDGTLVSGSEGASWQECGDALLWLRQAEKDDTIPADAQQWPYVCARRWWESRTGDVPTSYAAAFEQYLFQEVRPEARLQFFSEGELVDGGLDFEKGSTQVAWLEHDTQPLVIISFRGTEPDKWGDIVADLDVFKEPFSTGDATWGEVHSGFKQALEAVLPLLEARADLLMADPGDARVWITGHSLGGALATMMTAWVMRQMETDPSWASFPLAGLVTFGSPRVGNPEFVAQFNSRTDALGVNHMRFVNADDIVTRIPAVGYDHVGDTYYLGEEDDSECPNDDPCFVVLPGDSGGAYLGSAGDHSIVNYYDRLVVQLGLPDNAPYLSCQ